MALSGNTREFSLADLIVVKAQDPRSHRLTLSGPAGDGLLLIESGRIVHAAYGELPALWITGHEEPTEARDELAAARARTVAEFLEGQRIDPSRMTVDSRGSSEPLASNAELEGRRSNRRVDVWILPH